jgi:hypothetical protein
LPKTSSRIRTQERLHRRVSRGEPVRPRVSGYVGQPQRARVGDQLTEQAAALRPVVYRRDLFLVQAHRDELGQPPALSDDPERAVTGIDERDRGLDDLPEDHFQLEVGADGDDRIQQRMDAVARLDHGREPGLHLGQQVIQAQLGQQRLVVSGFHAPSRRIVLG